jgi:hypothetical protein
VGARGVRAAPRSRRSLHGWLSILPKRTGGTAASQPHPRSRRSPPPPPHPQPPPPLARRAGQADRRRVEGAGRGGQEEVRGQGRQGQGGGGRGGRGEGASGSWRRLPITATPGGCPLTHVPHLAPCCCRCVPPPLPPGALREGEGGVRQEEVRGARESARTAARPRAAARQRGGPAGCGGRHGPSTVPMTPADRRRGRRRRPMIDRVCVSALTGHAVGARG